MYIFAGLAFIVVGKSQFENQYSLDCLCNTKGGEFITHGHEKLVFRYSLVTY